MRRPNAILISAAMTLTLLAASCQKPADNSMVRREVSDQGKFVLALNHAVFGVISSQFAYSGTDMKTKMIGSLIGLLAGHQAFDLLSITFADRGSVDLSYQIMLQSQGSYLKIKNRDIIRHLRRYQDLYLAKTPEDLVDEDGQVNDQFLAGLLLAWQKHNAPREEKMDLIRQVHLVLTMDRDDGRTTAGQLKNLGVTDPNVLQLNLGMNGLRHRSSDETIEKHVKFAALSAIAEWFSVGAIMFGDPDPGGRMLGFGILVATAVGSVSWGHRYIDTLVFKTKGRTFTVHEQELATSFAAYRIHFANRSIDDIITTEGQIIDPFAEAILGVFNESGQRWTNERNRRFLEQLLIVLQADTSDSVDDLVARGIIDTKFIEMFEAWKGLERNRSMRGERS